MTVPLGSVTWAPPASQTLAPGFDSASSAGSPDRDEPVPVAAGAPAGAPSGAAAAVPATTPVPQLQTTVTPGQPLPSPGSAEHGTGECKPCAWFWKPQGCSNGANCGHCHLCPQGELKARKKLKRASLRGNSTAEQGSTQPAAIADKDPYQRPAQDVERAHYDAYRRHHYGSGYPPPPHPYDPHAAAHYAHYHHHYGGYPPPHQAPPGYPYGAPPGPGYWAPPAGYPPHPAPTGYAPPPSHGYPPPQGYAAPLPGYPPPGYPQASYPPPSYPPPTGSYMPPAQPPGYPPHPASYPGYQQPAPGYGDPPPPQRSITQGSAPGPTDNGGDGHRRDRKRRREASPGTGGLDGGR